MSNRELADIFSLFSKLLDIHAVSENEAKLFSTAAFQLKKMEANVFDLSSETLLKMWQLGKIPAQKIIELKEHKKIQQLEDLIAKTPNGIIELSKIKGLGPKKIAQLWKELEIESPGELLYACYENRLVKYKGFGEKTQQNIIEAIEFYNNNQQKFLFAEAILINEKIKNFLELLFLKCWINEVGNLLLQDDIIETFQFLINIDDDEIEHVLKDKNEVSNIKRTDVGVSFLLFENYNIELISSDEDEYRDNQFIFSFKNEALEKIAELISEIETEPHWDDDTYFEELNLAFIPNALRHDIENIELAAENNLPTLISTEDIKGIIHNHSTWSDGQNSIEEMALACMQKGFEYFVISDHSKTSFYANGLTEIQIEKQHQEIEMLNLKYPNFKIFKSIECDILSDGSLDYDTTILSQFDLVICSVHQNLKMTEEKAMTRLLNAIENPYTTILGHPTGRLLLSRKGYPIDHKKIIDACAANRVAIEINANPRRLDMDYTWIKYAKNKNVLMSINPDAHSILGIDDIKYGVLSAQKGGLEPNNNLSSMNLQEFEAFLSLKHKQ
ncbi:MAG: DNA polymerase/3'-5' exonuclease PolX [Chitinophagaceae bacterium]|nr:DNA polymerase/3'-5' exonuclease PolX [Chitinophagaceae bacterium]